MSVKTVYVELEKRSNDGDYGSELAKVAWSYELEDGEDAATVTAALQGLIRGRVEQDLSQSANLKVRRSLIRETRTCGRCSKELADSDNGYLHAECKATEDAERAERWARSNANAEQRAGVIADDDDDDDVPL